MITVMSGIPMPKPNKRWANRGRPPRYPWETLQPGQMFFIGDRDADHVHTCTCMARKRYGKNFRARPYKMNGQWGMGVWLIPDETN